MDFSKLLSAFQLHLRFDKRTWNSQIVWLFIDTVKAVRNCAENKSTHFHTLMAKLWPVSPSVRPPDTCTGLAKIQPSSLPP